MDTSLLSRILGLMLLVVTFTGCSKYDDQPPAQTPDLYSYRIQYMNYPDRVMPLRTKPKNVVTLQYDADGRVISRWGDVIPINPSSGYEYAFTDGLYEDVEYQGNQIIITEKDTLKDINVHPDRRIITLEDGKMVRFIKEKTFSTTTTDTTYLYYNQNKVARTIKKAKSAIHYKDFFYDGSGNLTTIKGLGIDRFSKDTTYFQEETFQNYDQAFNPVRKLFMFEELYLRSLSVNNYRKYTWNYVTKDSSQYDKGETNWNFKYDSSGNIMLEE